MTERPISKIISAAHLVLVPVVPSPHDLRAIDKTIAMVEEQEVPMVFVVNNAGAGRLTTQAAVVLKSTRNCGAGNLSYAAGLQGKHD